MHQLALTIFAIECVPLGTSICLFRKISPNQKAKAFPTLLRISAWKTYGEKDAFGINTTFTRLHVFGICNKAMLPPWYTLEGILRWFLRLSEVVLQKSHLLAVDINGLKVLVFYFLFSLSVCCWVVRQVRECAPPCMLPNLWLIGHLHHLFASRDRPFILIIRSLLLPWPSIIACGDLC